MPTQRSRRRPHLQVYPRERNFESLSKTGSWLSLTLTLFGFCLRVSVRLAVAGQYLNEPESTTPEIVSVTESLPDWVTLVAWSSSWDNFEFEV